MQRQYILSVCNNMVIMDTFPLVYSPFYYNADLTRLNVFIFGTMRRGACKLNLALCHNDNYRHISHHFEIRLSIAHRSRDWFCSYLSMTCH